MSGPIRTIQWGPNVGPYNANVAATTLLPGEHPKVTPSRKTQVIEEDIPARSTGFRGRQDTALAQNTLRLPNAWFEMIPIMASMCLKGGVVPVEQSVGEGDMLWDFAPSESAALALDHGTLELGDGITGYAIDGMIVPKIKISGTIPQDGGVAPVAFEMDYFGKDNTPQALTPAIPFLPTTLLNAKLARCWMDDTWAALGGTEITGLRRFAFDILMGHTPSMDGSADIHSTGFDEGALKVMAVFLFKRGTLTDGLYDDFIAKQTKFMEFVIDGPQIGAGVNNSLTMKLAAEVMTTPFEQFDRNQIFDGIALEGLMDITAAKQFEFDVITEKAVL